jgi:hypothetical protein
VPSATGPKVAVSDVLVPPFPILIYVTEISRANFAALCVQVLEPAQYRTTDPAATRRRATIGRQCPLLALEGDKAKVKDFSKWMRKVYKHAVDVIDFVCASPTNPGLDRAALLLDAQKLRDGEAVDGDVCLAELADRFSNISL